MIGRRLVLTALLGTAARAHAAPAAALSAEGLPRGIYGPTRIGFGSVANLYGALGNYFVRGMAGVTRMTITGPDANAVTTGDGGTIFASWGLWALPPGQERHFTVTFDNALSGGTDRLSLPVTVVGVDNSHRAVINTGTTVTDAQPPPFDARSPHQIRFIGNATMSGLQTDWSKVRIGGPDAALVSLYAWGSLQTTEAAWPLSAHYGEHHITLQVRDEPPLPVTFYILKEGTPAIAFTPVADVYDNWPPGSLVGTVHASNDLGGFTFAQAGTVNPNFKIGTKTGDVTVARSLAGRANATERLTIRASSGTSFADIPVAIPIGAGTTLPASNMTARFATSLDNSMSHGTVGTVAVRGIDKPIFRLDVADDECQSLTAYPNNNLTPRYTIKPSGAATAVVSFSYLSAQTDTIVITAVAGPLRCTSSFPLTVAAKAGPTKTIGPAGTGRHHDFPSVNAAMDAAWKDPAGYAGAVFLLADMDYSRDFSRSQLGHGTPQPFWPGPVTLRGLDPDKLTLIDMQGRTSSTGKGLIIQNSWDLTVENLEICRVSNASGNGRPNAAGIYKEQQTPGNITVRGCYIHDCDNGIQEGDAGTHWTISDTVLAMCGAADYGFCHNAYIGPATSVTANNLLSFATADVHAFKSRAFRTTIRDSALLDGENGGASSMLDTPNGGVVRVSGSILQKGPNPQNDANTIQYAAEGIDKPVSNALYDGNILINTLRDGNSFGNAVGIANSGSVDPFDGSTNSVVFSNNKFYNFDRARWTSAAYNNSGPATDGGGNVNLATWPVDLDPATVVKLSAPVRAALQAHPPGPGFTNAGNPGFSQTRVLMQPLALQLRVPAGAAPGTIVNTATGYDRVGMALTDATYRLLDSAAGQYAIDPRSGVVTVARPLRDGLDFIRVGVTGTGLDGTRKPITLSSWFFVVVGQGTVRRR